MMSIVDQMKLYDPIKRKIAIIRDEIRKIDELKRKEGVSVRSEESKKIALELDKIVSVVSRLIVDTKDELDANKLKCLSNDDLINFQEGMNVASNPSISLYYLHSRKFKEVMYSYYIKLNEFQTVSKQKWTRQLQIVNPALTDENANIIIDNGQVQQFVMKELNASHTLPSEELDTVVQELCERYDGVIKLEKTMKNIQNMFEMFNFLIDTQQETMDVIETRVRNTKQSVVQATTDLKEGEKQNNKSNKRRCWILVAIMSILAITLIPLWIRITK